MGAGSLSKSIYIYRHGMVVVYMDNGARNRCCQQRRIGVFFFSFSF